tara:strand:+ start:379 stop:600 length:222 start_codon:yes stop_codon:yes gene_type:complete
MLSVSKLLLIVAVVGIVVVAGKLLRGKRDTTPPAKPRDDRTLDAVDLDQCRVCGQYVAADAAPCERADCPKAG